MMLGFIILFLMLGMEVGFIIYSLMTKSYQVDKKKVAGIGAFVVLTVLAVFGVVQFGFRWYLLFFVLIIKTITGIWYFAKRKLRKEKKFTKRHVILAGIGNCLILGFAIMPSIIFPQFKPAAETGDYKVASISYTLTDQSRLETFGNTGENRKVTIQFWYPENADGKYPLVVFSHGAFGYRGSNRSTYKNLASNGYVVCSIDHTYHSFFTKQTDGKVVIADMKFINDAMAAQNNAYDEKTTYDMSHEWLELRIGDVNFVLDTILENIAGASGDKVYQEIDTDKIGVFGHSLGGATSAEIGRERKDIDAVIVVDGTMFGEETSFEDGKAVLNNEPYPVPLLNIYNEEHYKQAQEIGEEYANISATEHAIDAHQVVVKGAGHLNFTDLPLFSPTLAAFLGTGDVDSRYCIDTMNQVILNYFNYYLKNSAELDIQEEY